jgi:MFS transporter, DHA1 family, tetracycline resistance protein
MARNAGVGFIFVTLLLDVIGIGLVVPVLPSLVEQLVGGNETAAAPTYGLLVAVYALLQTLCAPLLGALSDRFGRRPVILLALAGMGTSYVIQALAPSVGWLLVGRVFAGVTGATITPANAYIADVSQPESRARNFGLVGVAFGVGFVLGPLLGGLLGQLDPRAPFYAAAGTSFLSALWGYFVLPESLPPERRRAKLVWTDAIPLRGLVALRVHPVVSGLAWVILLSSLAQRGMESIWVLHGGFRYGWGNLESGLSLAAVGVAAALVQGGLVRRVVPRLGEARSMLLGLGLNATSLALYVLASRSWMAFAIIPIGALGALTLPALQSLVVSVVEPDQQGTVQGSLASVQSLASVFAPILSAALFVRGTDGSLGASLPGLPFAAGSAFVVLALAQAARTLSRHARRGASAAGAAA